MFSPFSHFLLRHRLCSLHRGLVVAAAVSAFLIVGVSTVPAIAQESECVAAYANATRSVAWGVKQRAESAYWRSMLCDQHGEALASAENSSLNTVIKQIPFNFSSSAKSDVQKLEEFCHVERSANRAASFSSFYANTVVTDALRSFNQCLNLENRRLVITSNVQDPLGVVIYGKFLDRTTNATLDTVSYDSNKVTCTSTNFSSAGTSIKLDASHKYPISTNFNITCKRKGFDKKGYIQYPRATITVSTNLGPYSVVLQSEKLYGFTLANQAKEAYDNLEKKLKNDEDAFSREKLRLNKEIQAKQNKVNQLTAQLNSAGVASWHVFSTGEYDGPAWFRPRFYCGTHPEPKAKQMCHGGPYSLHRLSSYGGNKCGYSNYVVACLKR